MLCGVGEAVAVNVGVPANGVFVGDGPADPVPTNEITQDAGILYVKEFPLTATAVWATRLLLASVSHGVTVVTESPLRLNCWLVADEFWFMTTIANFPVFGSVYAEQLRPVVGASVAPMRTKPGFTNLE
jgi:hypothetical protein